MKKIAKQTYTIIVLTLFCCTLTKVDDVFLTLNYAVYSLIYIIQLFVSAISLWKQEMSCDKLYFAAET